MHEVKKYIGGCEVYCQRRILLFFAAMSHIESHEVERVMQALPPEGDRGASRSMTAWRPPSGTYLQ